MSNEQLTEILITEIRENRKEIRKIKDSLNKMDRHIFSNKIKLSIFMGGFTLFFSLVWAILFEKIKTLIV